MRNTAYYFIRANGKTAHNNPAKPRCYIGGEPPQFPETDFNYVKYCLGHGVARIGWPATGDLRAAATIPSLTPCYPIPPRLRNYLNGFRAIERDSVVLLPDPSNKKAGTLYIGTVTKGYDYTYALPKHPYECAHRVKVEWDCHDGHNIVYQAEDLGIGIHGGFWTRAFHRIDITQKRELIDTIERARKSRR